MQSVMQALGWGVQALERIRIQRHLSDVETDLRAADTRGLPPETPARRARNLDRLRAYRMAGQFPKNMRVPHRRTPVFVDDEGTPCAVASLMLQSGERNLVESVARIDNHLNIREVRAGPVIGWLEQEGLTKEEAARIQPSYSPALDLEIFATALFAVFLPLKIVGDAVWRKVTRVRQQAGAWAALGITIGVVFASVGIAVGAAVVLRPTTDTYAGIYRTALVLAFLLTLLPLELAALWALLHEGSHQVQRWRAVSPYLGLVNVGIAIVLAILIVPALVDFVG